MPTMAAAGHQWKRNARNTTRWWECLVNELLWRQNKAKWDTHNRARVVELDVLNLMAKVLTLVRPSCEIRRWLSRQARASDPCSPLFSWPCSKVRLRLLHLSIYLPLNASSWARLFGCPQSAPTKAKSMSSSAWCRCEQHYDEQSGHVMVDRSRGQQLNGNRVAKGLRSASQCCHGSACFVEVILIALMALLLLVMATMVVDAHQIELNAMISGEIAKTVWTNAGCFFQKSQQGRRAPIVCGLKQFLDGCLCNLEPFIIELKVSVWCLIRFCFMTTPQIVHQKIQIKAAS